MIHSYANTHVIIVQVKTRKSSNTPAGTAVALAVCTASQTILSSVEFALCGVCIFVCGFELGKAGVGGQLL